MIFDEFIPEKIVIHRKAEGDGFLNAYRTISGNRELLGGKPLIMWLLANANSINSPILQALEVMKPLERLMRSDKEWLIYHGIFMAYPRSRKVIEKQKETALMKHLSDKSQFKRMALYNEFAYDNTTMVKPRDIKGFVPYISVGPLHIYHTKDKNHYYVCRIPHKKYPKFDPANDKERFTLMTTYVDIRLMYEGGYMSFDSVESLLEFNRIWDIKEKVT